MDPVGGGRKRLTHGEYIKILKTVRQGKVTVLEPYKGKKKSIKHICSTHGEFKCQPTFIVNSCWESSCCVRSSKKVGPTEKEYKRLLKKKYEGRIQLVGKYTPNKQMLHSCSVHGEFLGRKVIIANDGYGTECGCFKSKLGLQARTIVRTQESYDKMLKENSKGRVKRIDPYIDLKTRIMHYCKLHDHYFYNSHYNTRLNDTCGCPLCGFDNTIKGRYRSREVTFGSCTFTVQGYEPQALQYLIETKGIKPKNILAGVGSKITCIPYFYGKLYRNYHPDIFIPKKNKLIEVKSIWTLVQRKSIFYTNAKKARVCIELGYNFQLLVFKEDGTRIKVPKDWYNMRYSEICKHFMFNPKQ